MTQPIAVVALNGFLGDRRGHLDVGELVNARAILAGVPFYERRRGGAARGGGFGKLRLTEWVDKRLWSGLDMVFVGKSYGAHWIADLLAHEDVARHSHALLFDPAHSLTRGEGRPRALPYPERITVVRQLGFRSGYPITGARDVVIKSNHMDIVSRKPALLELHNFLDDHLGHP